MKTDVTESYKKALKRNLNEVVKAILNQRAIIGIGKIRYQSSAWDFIRLAYDALHYSMIAYSIKTLEKRKGNASFWFIYHHEEKEVRTLIKKNNIDFDRIERMAESLLHIRDKTHFHIDKKAVKNSSKVWQKAAIKGNQMADVLNDLFLILNHLHEKEFGCQFTVPDYDGSDAAKHAEIAKKWRS